MSKLKNSVHLVNATSWVHPEDLKAYEKKVRNFVYTKKGKIRKFLLDDIKDINTNPDPENFIDAQIKKFQSAHRIHNYMKFRAFTEFPPDGKDRNGDEYGLTPEFFHTSFRKDCYTFFGIKCCPCCGEIIEDTQNPAAYSRFVDREKELKGPTVH